MAKKNAKLARLQVEA